jgi:hypothetical protein
MKASRLWKMMAKRTSNRNEKKTAKTVEIANTAKTVKTVTTVKTVKTVKTMVTRLRTMTMTGQRARSHATRNLSPEARRRKQTAVRATAEEGEN